jgi:hypothetical protein
MMGVDVTGDALGAVLREHLDGLPAAARADVPLPVLLLDPLRKGDNPDAYGDAAPDPNPWVQGTGLWRTWRTQAQEVVPAAAAHVSVSSRIAVPMAQVMPWAPLRGVTGGVGGVEGARLPFVQLKCNDFRVLDGPA